MRLIICLCLVLCSLPALAKIDETLQKQLINMAQQSHNVSQSLQKYAEQAAGQTLQSVAIQIDNLHTQTLKEIIGLHGWPSKQQVGEKGVQAMFKLVQYSQDLVFQQDMLPLVIQSYLDKGGIAGHDVAQFTDNISIKLGKKQVFGTQVEWIDGQLIFAPIENEDNVDLLRGEMGMPPLAEYKKTLEIFYGLRE